MTQVYEYIIIYELYMYVLYNNPVERNYFHGAVGLCGVINIFLMIIVIVMAEVQNCTSTVYYYVA